MTRWIRTMVEKSSPCPSLPLFTSALTFLPFPPQPLIAAFASKGKKKEKTNPCFASIFLWTFHNLQDLLSTPLHSSYLSTPFPPSSFTFLHLRRSRGTGRSSLCASLGGCLLACDPSCASAWLTGWGSTPGRWCIGRARRRCGYAGAWSWPSSPWIAGGTACTQMASHLQMMRRWLGTTVTLVLLSFTNVVNTTAEKWYVY